MKISIKKLAVLLAGVTMLTSLTGCEKVIELMDSATESISGTTIDGRFYSDLKLMMDSPERLYNNSTYSSYIEKSIAFTALVLSEPEILDFDEEDGGPRQYISATIARNEDEVMLVDVNDLEEVPGIGEVVEIRGYVNGYIYYVVDNQSISKLDVKAQKITVKEPEDNPDTGNEISFNGYLENGTIVFRDAELTEDTFKQQVLLLYFDYTNTGDIDSLSPIERITFYQGDTYIARTGARAETELDSQALAHNAANLAKSGKTCLYYMVLAPEDKEQELTLDPLTAYFYDDNYNCLSRVEISVK